MNATEWKEHLDLEPHPEGGAYRETYRSDGALPEAALPERFDGERHAAAHIYYLLPAGDVSALHRIRQDELWHVYDGGPATLHIFRPDGTYHAEVLGRNPAEGGRLHAVVPAGAWFGLTIGATADFLLAGCTTVPAFDFADFELAEEKTLLDRYPEQEDVVRRLTRGED